MSRRIILVLTCSALTLGGTLLAGCGGKDKPAAITLPATSTPATSGGLGGAAEAGAVNVVMQNNLFSPEKITVKVGQKIHWHNNDSYVHTVTARTGAFSSKDVKGGGTFDYTPRKVGKIPYFCKIHSGQTGIITVTK